MFETKHIILGDVAGLPVMRNFEHKTAKITVYELFPHKNY